MKKPKMMYHQDPERIKRTTELDAEIKRTLDQYNRFKNALIAIHPHEALYDIGETDFKITFVTSVCTAECRPERHRDVPAFNLTQTDVEVGPDKLILSEKSWNECLNYIAQYAVEEGYF